MCVPACTRKIAADLSRRNFLRGVAGATAAAATVAVAGCNPMIDPNHQVRSASAKAMMSGTVSFSGIVDALV